MYFIYREPYSEIITHTDDLLEVEKKHGIILKTSDEDETYVIEDCLDMMSENLQKYEAFIQSDAYKALEGTPLYDIISANVNETITILARVFV